MQAFWNANKTNNALKIGKENEMLMVVDTSLLPLNELMIYYLGVFSKIEKFTFVPPMEGVPTIGHWLDLGMIVKVIFQGLFLENNFLDIFWGSFRGV